MFDEPEKRQDPQPDGEGYIVETNKDASEEEAFSFMQETVKDEQVSMKRVLADIGKLAGRGVIFGIAACVAFCVFQPWMQTKFGSAGSVVEIPQDSEEENGETAEEQIEEKEEIQQPVLTIDNYRELSRAMYQVALDASRSVVQVEGIGEEEVWTAQDFDEGNSVGGVAFADTGSEVLILAPARVSQKTSRIAVEFSDRSVYEATIKRQDKNTGIAVYAVPRSRIADSTWTQIKIASLGNSHSTGRGDAVIAVGNQFGYAGGIGYGIISSVRNEIVLADGEFGLLTTDIPAAESGSGVLFNLSGEVVGLTDQSLSGESNEMVLGYAISDIKKHIERLSNGKPVPYLGIKGVEVSKNIAEQQAIPEGIYVMEVEADSPAMQAGIKSGDVIVMVGGTEVKTVSGYKNSLLDCTVGEEVRIKGKRQGASGYVDINFRVAAGSKE